MSTTRPDIFEYLDHRAFLGDWFQWKKSSNPRFSHRMFARLAKQKSPSLLLLVTKGERNLTPATTRAFARAMKLEPEETRFFTLLVQLDSSNTAKERTAIFERIAATQRFRSARPIEGDGFAYLSRWFIPAVRELASVPGFQPDPVWIARRIRPRITVAQATRALSVLDQLGMVRVADDGAVTVSDADLVTPHEVIGLAVHNYHRGMLARSLDAIEGFKARERHLGAVTVRVPAERIGELKRAVAEFQERFLDLAESMTSSKGDEDSPRHESPPQRVVQMNVQLFPLSAAIAVAETE